MDWEFDPRNADIGMVCTVDSNRPGFSYTPLFESRLVAVCSPNLLKNQLALASPRDVARFTLLELYTAAGDWDAWLGPGGRSGLGEAASIRFDSYLLALEAACDGQGIALAPDFLAEPDLASGRLVSPIRHSVPQPARWYLVARQDRADELAIGRFRDWLIKEVEPLRRL
jgi:LysR family glycine cleavage system transcriptional activator